MEKIFSSQTLNAQSLKRWLGVSLLAVSFAFYGSLLLLPVLPFVAERKIALSAALILFGEGSFWIAALILGREAMAKFHDINWRVKPLTWRKRIYERIKSMRQ